MQRGHRHRERQGADLFELALERVDDAARLEAVFAEQAHAVFQVSAGFAGQRRLHPLEPCRRRTVASSAFKMPSTTPPGGARRASLKGLIRSSARWARVATSSRPMVAAVPLSVWSLRTTER